jgi:hypothetical protein
VERVKSLQVVGDQQLGRELATIVARARRRPATFSDGSPAYFKFHGFIRAFVAEGEQAAQVARAQLAPDIFVTVKAMPAGLRSPYIYLLLAVNADGTIAACQPSAREAAKSIAESLCTASERFSQPILNDKDGKPVRYVTEVNVRLQPKPVATNP